MPRKGVHGPHAHVCRWGGMLCREKWETYAKARKDECPGGIGVFETKPRKVRAVLNTMSPGSSKSATG